MKQPGSMPEDVKMELLEPLEQQARRKMEPLEPLEQQARQRRKRR